MTFTNDKSEDHAKESQTLSSPLPPELMKYAAPAEEKTRREMTADQELPANHSSNKRGWWAGLLVTLGFLFGKLKFLMGPLYFVLQALKLGKFLTTGLSMVLMVVSYAFIYGWRYAVGVVLLIFVHEIGHMYFAKLKKLDVSLPVFIPFLGAYIKMKEEPKDAKTEAFVAVGGPLIGMLGAFVCLSAAFSLQSELLAALAYFGFFITVFNMIPAHPLDGGRIAASLSPSMWIIGIIGMAVMTIYYFNPLALIILFFAIKKAWNVWKHRDEQPPGYYDVDTSFRVKMGLTYFLIFGVSSFFTYFLHELLGRP